MRTISLLLICLVLCGCGGKLITKDKDIVLPYKNIPVGATVIRSHYSEKCSNGLPCSTVIFSCGINGEDCR